LHTFLNIPDMAFAGTLLATSLIYAQVSPKRKDPMRSIHHCG
jgi:hypothetical protein